MARHLLAIDQGTTGTTALVMDLDGNTRARVNRELPQHFPAPGWVEHDAAEIWQTVIDAVEEALTAAGVSGIDVLAVGITNQRETTLVWDRATDAPLGRALVWQDRRTADRCLELKEAGHEPLFRARTGLVLDPYFSGTKLEWLLQHHPGARERAERGELCFGTVDSFLVWKLAGGARHDAPHVTDATNASRTLLMNLAERRWDPELAALLRVPLAVLPRIVPSAGPVARTRGFPALPDGVPIAGMAGDQHAALFGQACFEVGDVKCTYGTGAFVLANVGSAPVPSRFGLLSTLAWQIGDQPTYALEGSAFIAGAAVQWLRDGLGLLAEAAEVERLAAGVPSTDGVFFVPALAGLGAPYWDPQARGLITGITRGTTRAHLCRATLEAIAFEVQDLVGAMSDDLGRPITRLRVDGGAAANDLLLQCQADLSRTEVERPTELESTARGAAMLAGIGAGAFQSGAEAAAMMRVAKVFSPRLPEAERVRRIAGWHDAVRRARTS